VTPGDRRFTADESAHDELPTKSDAIEIQGDQQFTAGGPAR
jgi:hypothetical protein